MPAVSTRSMSSEPVSRSSVAPTGSSASVTGRSSGWCRAVGAGRAGGVGRGGIAGVRAAGNHRHRRQQRGQPADHGRLRGALLAADQDPADGRGHRVEQQRQLQVRHPDDAGERIRARLIITGRRRHRSQSFPGFLARSGGTQRQPESLAPGRDGDLAGHPRSQLRDSPGFAPAFLRVATSAQHDIPAGRGAGQYRLTRRVHWPRPECLLSSPGAHVASHSAGNSQLTRVA